MFTGSYFHTMDNKGRVRIPSRYLEIIEKDKDRHITITNWEGYVLAFPQSDWITFAEDLAKMPILEPDFRPIQRLIYFRRRGVCPGSPGPHPRVAKSPELRQA